MFELSLKSFSHKFPQSCVGRGIQAEDRVSKLKGMRCGTFQKLFGVAENCVANS